MFCQSDEDKEPKDPNGAPLYDDTDYVQTWKVTKYHKKAVHIVQSPKHYSAVILASFTCIKIY